MLAAFVTSVVLGAGSASRTTQRFAGGGRDPTRRRQALNHLVDDLLNERTDWLLLGDGSSWVQLCRCEVPGCLGHLEASICMAGCSSCTPARSRGNPRKPGRTCFSTDASSLRRSFDLPRLDLLRLLPGGPSFNRGSASVPTWKDRGTRWSEASAPRQGTPNPQGGLLLLWRERYIPWRGRSTPGSGRGVSGRGSWTPWRGRLVHWRRRAGPLRGRSIHRSGRLIP